MNAFGLSEENFSLLKKLVIDPLKNMNAKVYVFGSRARGDQRKFSDIDLLFELPPTSGERDAEVYLIKSAIEESHFPYKVDLVEMKSLAASYKTKALAEMVAV